MDRIAACKVYQKEDYTDASPWLYHQKSKRVQAVMHPESLALLNHLLQMLAEEGEKKTFAYAKQLVQKDRISRWKKCHLGCNIQKQTGECIMPNEGVFAIVLNGGEIKAQDTIFVEA